MNVYSGTLQSGIALYSQNLIFGQVKAYPPANGGHPSASPAADNERSTRSWRTGAHQSTSDRRMEAKMNKKWYAGVKKYSSGYNHADIFSYTGEVTEKTHGHLYAFCFGSYRTQREAIQVAMYQNYIIDTPQPERI